MTPESAISAPDASSPAIASTSTVADSSSAGTSPAPQTEQTAGPANAGDVQGNQPTPQEDDFAGVPSLDELKALAEQNAPHAKSLIQLRSAIEEKYKPQLTELAAKFAPFESVADRFQSAEEIQKLVGMQEKLFGWENDPDSGQLVPSTQSFAEELAQGAPETADFLCADLMNGMTRDPQTGRTLSRIDLALEAMKGDPGARANALKILGGVEPSTLAPTWQPTAEELQSVRPELQDIYKKLPYETREDLKLNSPDFINNYLQDQQLKQTLEQERTTRATRDQQDAQRRERYVESQATQAGDTYVEQQFKEGFSGFAKSICEKSQFIAPIDPQSPEAQQMGPEGVAQMNQEIQNINQGTGMLVSLAVGALAHRDTRFMAEEFFKSIGVVTDDLLKGFDSSRLEFANNARNYGYLNHKGTLGQQNGQNGNRMDLSSMQANASKSLRSMIANGNAVARPIMQMLSKFFELKAGTHNQTLNGAAAARPAVSGRTYDPTTASQTNPYIGKKSDEIYGSLS